jgi:hypothetical protein
MTWFAVLFGIINLLIAYGVMRLYTHATAHAHDVPAETPGAGSRPATDKPLADRGRDKASLPRTSTSVQVHPTGAKEREANGMSAIAESEMLASAAKQNTIPAETNVQLPPSTSEWQDELQAIGQRIRYARLVGEKQLAKDAAVQLRGSAVMWQRRLDGYLKGASAADDADQVEMCLAQIESTLSNLDAVPWNETAATAFDCIEREFAVLEKAVRNLKLGEAVSC